MKQQQPIFTPTFFLVCMFSLTFLLLGSRICAYEGQDYGDEETVTATVMEILYQESQESQGGYTMDTVYFTAKVTDGALKGTTVDVVQYIDQLTLPIPEVVTVGESVLLIANYETQGTAWVYADDNTVPAMAVMVGLFILCILLIGRGKGVATLLSLLFTMVAIFYIYIPAILLGRNIYITTIVVIVFIILSSLLLLNGSNVKTFCAIIGNVGGILLTGMLALIFNSAMGITGIVDQDYIFLTLLAGDVTIDLQAVVWGAILIGSLGAIMDVSMSISSAINELAHEMERPSFRRLGEAGMRIGQDVIGTMTNTLILAYVGSSMVMVLLFAAYDKNTMILLNLEMISIEIIQAVVGSMGILLAVPLTVACSAWIFSKQGKREG